MREYQPPLTLTPHMLALAAEIGEYTGHLSALHEETLAPQLCRDSHIRTIQASPAIGSNTLSVEQVVVMLDDKCVLGLPCGIQEVHGAFLTYEVMPEWQPNLHDGLLAAHMLLMYGSIDDAGSYQHGGIDIYRGKRLLHMTPPASRVPQLMDDLLTWLNRCELYPLITSYMFHCESEFTRPFADDSGRMGRLWQTLIFSRW